MEQASDQSPMSQPRSAHGAPETPMIPSKRLKTESTKRRHVWKSFSARIEAIDIDVAHRLDRRAGDAEDVDSFFVSALDKWAELNLTVAFKLFLNDVAPLVQSLPQVLHHKQRLYDRLAELVRTRDALVEEAAFDLIIQLARDLQTDFAPFAAGTISLLGELADHEAVEVVEGAFTAMAHLFKFLSKIMVRMMPDIFGAIEPLLEGRPHVLRFAAQAFSFLLRRSRQPDFIADVVRGAEGQSQTHIEGVAHIFAETLQGPGRSIDTRGLQRYEALLDAVEGEAGSDAGRRIVEYCTIATVHHTDAQHGEPFFDAVLRRAAASASAADALFYICAVRKGTRVLEARWAEVTKLATSTNSTKLAIAAFAYAPLTTSMRDAASCWAHLQSYKDGRALVFATVLAKLSPNVFKSLFLSHYRADLAGPDRAAALQVAPVLRAAGVFDGDSSCTRGGKLVLSEQAAQDCVQLCLASSDDRATTYLLLQALRCLDVKVDAATIASRCYELLDARTDVASSDGATLIASLVESLPNIDDLFARLLEHTGLWANAHFLEALYAHRSVVKQHADAVTSLLLSNLDKPGRDRRAQSLKLLSLFEPSELVTSMQSLEITELTLTAPRGLALHTRKLGQLYPTATPLVKEAIFRQCFGLLTGNYTPLWSLAVENLKLIGESQPEAVFERCFAWLVDDDYHEPPIESLPHADATDSLRQAQTDSFKCFNAFGLVQQYVASRGAVADAEGDARRAYRSAIENSERHSYPRSQAIYALKEMPQLAERYNRRLVPIFLQQLDSVVDDEETSGYTHEQRTNLLALFSRFDNPAALAEAARVRSVAMHLLATRDAKAQTLALDLLLHYNEAAITAYTDNLRNLLSEPRSRDEIATFLQVSSADSPIEDAHRAQLMPVVAAVLYGKMMNRRHASSAKRGQANTRTTILGAIATLPPEDVACFVEIFLRQVPCPTVEQVADGALPELTSWRRLVGFCNMIEDAFEQLAGKLLPFLDDLMGPLAGCHALAEREIETAGPDAESAIRVRQSSSRVLALATQYCSDWHWQTSLASIFAVFIKPRLARLAAKSSQAPSPLLRVFATWAEHAKCNAFLLYDGDIFKQVFALLSQPTVKEPVVRTVLEMVFNLVQHGNCLSADHCNLFLSHLLVFQRQSSNAQPELVRMQTAVLAGVAPMVDDVHSLDLLLDLVLPLLHKPERFVPSQAKTDILKLVLVTLPKIEGDGKLEQRWRALSTLFRVVPSASTRLLLCEIMLQFGQKDEQYEPPASLIAGLNAMSTKRLDAPDFDRRLGAFTRLTERAWRELTPLQWLPIVHNLIFFLNDREELAVRTNAAHGFDRFFEAMSLGAVPDLLDLVYDAISKGFRQADESLRQEWITVLGSAVRLCPDWNKVSDLTPLMAGGNEEANFFNNILHIQQHRRIRALARLVKVCDDNAAHPTNVAHLLMPLVEHFCFLPKEANHNLSAAAVNTVGGLAKGLQLNQFTAVFKRHVATMTTENEHVSVVVRLVGALVDALTAMQHNDKLEAAIMHTYLPNLDAFLKNTEEQTIPLRVPLALTVVKLLTLVSSDKRELHLPGVLSHISHVLRSRSQDARDKARSTLGEIAALLGPSSLTLLVKQLADALRRGYQLHVLGFTLHTVLLRLAPLHGEIDDALPRVVDVLIDDVFGETGVEKDAEAYISTMKELKSNKSYDSFEMVAKAASLERFAVVLHPVQRLLVESSSVKSLRKIEEVLRRLSLGLYKNAQGGTREALIFCYNVYELAVVKSAPESVKESRSKDDRKAFMVDLNARKAYHKDHFATNAHRLVRFALDVLRNILTGHPEMMTSEHFSAFVPLVGDAIMSPHEDVQMSALRLLTLVVRLDDANLQSGMIVFVDRTMQLIKAASSTSTELCQVALKFMAAVIRDRHGTQVLDAFLAYLLTRIKADLEQPERQGTSFTVVRAVMTRKLMLPELYDVIDEIGTIMVTNQSAHARQVARSTYYGFLLDYPQGRGRFAKQVAFLVQNLEYVHASGRESVLELLYQMTGSFPLDVLGEHYNALFLALTMCMVNDEEASCREAAARVLSRMVERASDELMKQIAQNAKLWLQSSQPTLTRAAAQVFGILVEAGRVRGDLVKLFLDRLKREAASEGDAEWQLLYYLLTGYAKLLQADPTAYLTSGEGALWHDISKLLLYPHAWVRITACRLLGTAFTHKTATSKTGMLAGKLSLSYEEIAEMAQRLLGQLRSPHISQELVTQNVKNLLFLVRLYEETGWRHETTSSLEWLLRKLASLLQSDKDVKQEGVRRDLIRVLAATTQHLSSDSLSLHAPILCRPLYKYAEAEGDELKDIAREALDLLREKLGPTRFAKIYSDTREHQLEVRRERQEKRRIERVADPDAAARKKLKRNVKKKQHRQDKSHAFRAARLNSVA